MVSQSRRAIGEEKLGVMAHLTAGRSAAALRRWSCVSVLRDTVSHHFTGVTRIEESLGPDIQAHRRASILLLPRSGTAVGVPSAFAWREDSSFEHLFLLGSRENPG